MILTSLKEVSKLTYVFEDATECHASRTPNLFRSVKWIVYTAFYSSLLLFYCISLVIEVLFSDGERNWHTPSTFAISDFESGFIPYDREIIRHAHSTMMLCNAMHKQSM